MSSVSYSLNHRCLMNQKGLSEKQYQERYSFLARVYYLLSNE